MPAKANTTHTVMENGLVVYRRERSSIWQCRFKVGGVWQRASTKQHKLKEAKEAARELMITAEVRKRDNLPVVTRRFRDVAKLAIKRMEDELNTGHGKVIYKDYIRVTKDYLIPALGNRTITSIDLAALEYLDGHRMQKMGKAPSASTLLTQNSALNRIFDEAVQKGLMTDSQRPKLETKGKKSVRRPAFELVEIKAVLENFDGWINNARNEHSRETRLIMRDYVQVLCDTGARPGKELLNLKWKQIKYALAPRIEVKDKVEFDVQDSEPEEIIEHDHHHALNHILGGVPTTILKLYIGFFIAPQSRSQIGSIISAPLDEVMSPISIMFFSFHPYERSNSFTFAFAFSSLPLRKTV